MVRYFIQSTSFVFLLILCTAHIKPSKAQSSSPLSDGLDETNTARWSSNYVIGTEIIQIECEILNTVIKGFGLLSKLEGQFVLVTSPAVDMVTEELWSARDRLDGIHSGTIKPVEYDSLTQLSMDSLWIMAGDSVLSDEWLNIFSRKEKADFDARIEENVDSLQKEFNDSWKYYRRELGSLRDDTYQSYLLNNKQRSPFDFEQCDRLSEKAILAPREKISSIFSDNGWWDDFYKLYPNTGGIVHFSRAGLSNDYSQALVYVSIVSGALGGSGHLLLLNKIEGSWAIKASFMQWIA